MRSLCLALGVRTDSRSQSTSGTPALHLIARGTSVGQLSCDPSSGVQTVGLEIMVAHNALLAIRGSRLIDLKTVVRSGAPR